MVNGKDIRKHRSDVLKLVAAGVYPEPVRVDQKLYDVVQIFVKENEQHIQSLADALGVDEEAVQTYLEVLQNEVFTYE